MQQLILPGIDFAPSQVLRYGLREFHHYPLASYGKNAAGIWLGSRRMPPAEAWTHPELELGRTANSIPALLFDIDRPDWGLEIFDGVVPVPNWATWRRANQHAHLVYALARPVLRGEQARPTPQGWLARIGEYIAATLQAGSGIPCGAGSQPPGVGQPRPLSDGLAARSAIHPGRAGRGDPVWVAAASAAADGVRAERCAVPGGDEVDGSAAPLGRLAGPGDVPGGHERGVCPATGGAGARRDRQEHSADSDQELTGAGRRSGRSRSSRRRGVGNPARRGGRRTRIETRLSFRPCSPGRAKKLWRVLTISIPMPSAISSNETV